MIWKGAVIQSYEQLERGLKDWGSFADPQVYDLAGMMGLLCACIENLRKNANHAEIEDAGQSLTDEERAP
jgi:hypothetical protein